MRRTDLDVDPTCEAVEVCIECQEESSASLGGLAGWVVVFRHRGARAPRYCCPECALVLRLVTPSSLLAPRRSGGS